MWSRYQVNLALIVIIISVIGWAYFSFYHQDLLDHELWKPPQWLQCLFPEVSSNPINNDCSQVINFDGWSVAHIFAYFLVGLVIPGHYLFILGFSIAFEAGEYLVGQRARWVMDPAANLIGYTIGSLLAEQVQPFIQKIFPPEVIGQKDATVWLVALAVIITAGLVVYSKSRTKKRDK